MQYYNNGQRKTKYRLQLIKAFKENVKGVIMGEITNQIFHLSTSYGAVFV